MKKIITGFSIVLFLGLTVNAYSQPQESQTAASQDFSRGAALYGSRCQFCHGVGGDGNGPAASALNPRPKDFTDPRFWNDTSNERIGRTILSGHGRGMPAFTFSTEDIKSVIDYISHFRKSSVK